MKAKKLIEMSRKLTGYDPFSGKRLKTKRPINQIKSNVLRIYSRELKRIGWGEPHVSEMINAQQRGYRNMIAYHREYASGVDFRILAQIWGYVKRELGK